MDKIMFYESDDRELLTLRETVKSEPTFSIIIPAFNEECRIVKTLSEWKSFLDTHFPGDYEILVIMDGCTDRTPEIVSDFARDDNSVIPLIYPKRLGKGGALYEVFRKAGGHFIFFTDADNSLPVTEFLKFIKALKVSDLVIGCRYWRGAPFISSLPLQRLLLSRAFNALLHIFFKKMKGIYDTQCGAKALRKSVFLAIKDDLFIFDFAFDVNLIYSALQKGFTVKSVYVDWFHFEEDSKVSGLYWRISLKMFLSILKLRIYYSRLRKMLYSHRFKNLLRFLLRFLYEDSVVQP